MCYSDYDQLKSHIRKIHEKVEDFKCKHCEKTFVTAFTLKRHLRNFHNIDESNKDYNCFYCDKIFTRTEDRKTHITSFHSECERDKKCPTCKNVFSNKYSLRKHIKYCN